jgi:hypothetical protein
MARSKEMTITKPKFTAADIEKDCPDRLQQLGKQIAARLEKIDKQMVQAENHSISVNQLITQAKELCDEGGFNAFREKFFPNLGKSRIYELLAIGTSKKSVEEIKAGTRARVAKHRANKTAAPASVTVTDKTEAQDAPMDAGSAEAACAPAAPTKRRMGDLQALVAFSTAVRELIRVTGNEKAERFAKTSVTADELARLGTFFTDIANLKVSGADVPVLPGNGTAAAPEQSPEIMNVERHARNAEEVRP